ncbi:hypothetical protein [Sphingomonas sp.]|uniref:hypothetical protein n=1 Tax=Sphingomonas sp. TaxID=28214 RepID=UPI001EC9BB8E|nr:hypothetical protein [Sphingomonas sp.]MBX3595258.1 hypothetical protein [Sphingomonas sp.]
MNDCAALAIVLTHGMTARIDRSAPFDVLTESIEFPVQSPEVTDLLAGMTAAFQRNWPGRTALAVKKILNKLQVDRSMGGPKVRAFLTVEKAMRRLRPD